MDYEYAPVNTMEEKLLPSPKEGTIATSDKDAGPGSSAKRSDWFEYPAERRQEQQISMTQVPVGRVLTQTGGNALQAVPRSILLEEKLSNHTIIKVIVPPNHEAGDVICVRTPDGQALVAATIPNGCFAGHVFFVRVPLSTPVALAAMGVPVDPACKTDYMVVPGRTVAVQQQPQEQHDLTLQEMEEQQQRQKQEPQDEVAVVAETETELTSSRRVQEQGNDQNKNNNEAVVVETEPELTSSSQQKQEQGIDNNNKNNDAEAFLPVRHASLV